MDQQGKTAPIHLLEDDQYEEGYAEIVRLFLAYHADPRIADSDGNTALRFSVPRGLDEVVALLKQQP